MVTLTSHNDGSMPQTLNLDVAEFSPNAWRWTLTDHAGAYIQHHQVEIDPAHACHRALLDLPNYLRVHAAPDQRQQDERRLTAELGDYIGTQVLGEAIARKLRDRARPSVVVRIRVPISAIAIFTLPLELARIDGAPLSGVSFVFQTATETPPAIEPIGERLRLLALFSVPPAGNALNLRRERQMLRKLVGELGGAAGRAIDLRVLQYGVSRDSLTQVLEEGEGWDVINFSGHGLPGALILENPDGTADHVSSTDLAALLAQAGARVKLVVLSACLSAAASIDQSLRRLGLDPASPPPRDIASPSGTQTAPTVAQALTQSLGCAVVAMRYSVEDEFASNFARALYEQLFRNQNALPKAARLALARTSGPAGALSVAAAALFGARAADLKLIPPQGDGFQPNPALDYVPLPPEYFVGRVAAMTKASAALALGSQNSGVLFHGMSGGGKTCCAQELIHHHASLPRFQQFVWFTAPEPGKDIEPALLNLAQAIERDLPHVKMVDKISNADEFIAWLPRLTAFLAQKAVLIALDNVETLLSAHGHWLDARWAALIDALLKPRGLSRLILTSRITPANLPEQVAVIPIHALARDESLLLAMETPNLRRLLDGKAEAMAKDDQRMLVRQVLRQAQGHPKLLDFAERLAADPAKLQAELAKFDATNPLPPATLDPFLQGAPSKLDIAAFMASLHAWTHALTATLPEPARLAFHFLCAIEEADRLGWIIDANWAGVWQALRHPGPPPAFAPLLATLISTGLVDRRTIGNEQQHYAVVIHPGLAEAGRAEVGKAIQEIVDSRLAKTWKMQMASALETHGKKPTGPVIVRAGLAAFPYLARLRDWETAAAMLERSVRVNRSPEIIAIALPMAQRIAHATNETEREVRDRLLLATIISEAGSHDEAEVLLRAAIDRAVERDEFATASGASGSLANLLRDNGRAAAAVAIIDRKACLTRQAGLGPWAQLSDHVSRMHCLNDLGSWQEVLNEVVRLRAYMLTLPDPPEANDWLIDVWNVREGLLGAGQLAAMHLKQWQVCLDINEEILQSLRERGASDLESAEARFNNHGPLLRLTRYLEARDIIETSLSVFQRENAIAAIAAGYSALADLESRLGHNELACRLEETGFRFRYLYVGSNNLSAPNDVAISHFNYANHLTSNSAKSAFILSHRLAAVMLRAVIKSGQLTAAKGALAADLAHLGPNATAALPRDIEQLRATVEQIEGVKFGALLRRFIDDAQATELLHSIIAKAQEPQP